MAKHSQHKTPDLTFRSLWETHAEPVHGHATLAANRGCAAAKWVQGDSANYQGQVEGQVHSSWNVHVDLEKAIGGNRVSRMYLSDVTILMTPCDHLCTGWNGFREGEEVISMQ